MSVDIQKLDNFLNDLEYITRINPVSALISCRTYIEGVINLILKPSLINQEQLSLAEKIQLLNQKGLVEKRILTEIENVRYHGNDASHKLIGKKSDACSSLTICKKIKKWFLENQNKFIVTLTDTELIEGKTYMGVINRVVDKPNKSIYGFINELHHFTRNLNKKMRPISFFGIMWIGYNKLYRNFSDMI